ncbi:putative Protein of unknown function C-terminus (DUF2451) [Blattamonas nauphoetae]|uniref:Syndetin C-terminal domain-containing protein n=1 Tax=Blattamonas nauphoetae TaxID=2049346 RepID=A0ABQ9XKD4_9EUKA|nr:putative Protein of unknown function C-terminus (DUF2451) [Blattamonas nauphoetae]
MTDPLAKIQLTFTEILNDGIRFTTLGVLKAFTQSIPSTALSEPHVVLFELLPPSAVISLLCRLLHFFVGLMFNYHNLCTALYSTLERSWSKEHERTTAQSSIPPNMTIPSLFTSLMKWRTDFWVQIQRTITSFYSSARCFRSHYLAPRSTVGEKQSSPLSQSRPSDVDAMLGSAKRWEMTVMQLVLLKRIEAVGSLFAGQYDEELLLIKHEYQSTGIRGVAISPHLALSSDLSLLPTLSDPISLAPPHFLENPVVEEKKSVPWVRHSSDGLMPVLFRKIEEDTTEDEIETALRKVKEVLDFEDWNSYPKPFNLLEEWKGEINLTTQLTSSLITAQELKSSSDSTSIIIPTKNGETDTLSTLERHEHIPPIDQEYFNWIVLKTDLPLIFRDSQTLSGIIPFKTPVLGEEIVSENLDLSPTTPATPSLSPWMSSDISPSFLLFTSKMTKKLNPIPILPNIVHIPGSGFRKAQLEKTFVFLKNQIEEQGKWRPAFPFYFEHALLAPHPQAPDLIAETAKAEIERITACPSVQTILSHTILTNSLHLLRLVPTFPNLTLRVLTTIKSLHNFFSFTVAALFSIPTQAYTTNVFTPTSTAYPSPLSVPGHIRMLNESSTAPVFSSLLSASPISIKSFTTLYAPTHSHTQAFLQATSSVVSQSNKNTAYSAPAASASLFSTNMVSTAPYLPPTKPLSIPTGILPPFYLFYPLSFTNTLIETFLSLHYPPWIVPFVVTPPSSSTHETKKISRPKESSVSSFHSRSDSENSSRSSKGSFASRAGSFFSRHSLRSKSVQSSDIDGSNQASGSITPSRVSSKRHRPRLEEEKEYRKMIEAISESKKINGDNDLGNAVLIDTLDYMDVETSSKHRSRKQNALSDVSSEKSSDSGQPGNVLSPDSQFNSLSFSQSMRSRAHDFKTQMKGALQMEIAPYSQSSRPERKERKHDRKTEIPFGVQHSLIWPDTQVPERIRRIPALLPQLVLTASITHTNRIIAAESLLSLSTLVSLVPNCIGLSEDNFKDPDSSDKSDPKIQDRQLFTLRENNLEEDEWTITQKKKRLEEEMGLAVGLFSNIIPHSKQIRGIIYHHIAMSLIGLSRVQSEIESVKWDTRNVSTDANPYISSIVHETSLFRARMENELSDPFFSNDSVLPPGFKKEVTKSLWRSTLEYIGQILIDGYSSIRKISDAGRQMIMVDLGSLENSLKSVVNRELHPPSQYFVNVKAFSQAISYFDTPVPIQDWAIINPYFTEKTYQAVITLSRISENKEARKDIDSCRRAVSQTVMINAVKQANGIEWTSKDELCRYTFPVSLAHNAPPSPFDPPVQPDDE